MSAKKMKLRICRMISRAIINKARLAASGQEAFGSTTMQPQAMFRWKFLMSCLVVTFLILDLLAFANWRNAFSADHAGSLAASFGPADNRRSVILSLGVRSPLA